MNDRNSYIQDLITHVQKEYSQQLEQQTSQELLSERALVALGYAIDNLKVIKVTKKTIVLSTTQNESRFRPGDHLQFKNPEIKTFTGILTDLHLAGHQLVISTNSPPPQIGSYPWVATENTSNLVHSTISALEKLQPGFSGWGFTQYLLGNPTIKPPLLTFPQIKPKTNPSNILSQLIEETNIPLDSSQQDAFLKCLNLPISTGIQGPPGTGKTLLLSFVAEGLQRMGKRVIIFAPTHQAINTSLSMIHELFPSRAVLKIGDKLRTDSLAPGIPILNDPKELQDLSPDSIIGMTFMSALQRIMIRERNPINPHVVIIDESGQLPLSQGISSGLSGAGTILLFGDDRQMPPVFSTSSAEDPLAISIFSQLRNTHPEDITMLNTTYRMNQELCDHISHTFYKDSLPPLIPHTTAKPRKLNPNLQNLSQNPDIQKALSPSPSLIWIKVPTQKYLQYNPEEATLISQIVTTILKAGYPPQEIAVVTPFRRQSMLIRNLVAKEIGTFDNLPIIDTVERVQGATVDIVIVSFCASQPEYITSLSNFLFSPNRLNVSISRARRKAIIVSTPTILNVLPLDHEGLVGRNICKELLENTKFFYYQQ